MSRFPVRGTVTGRSRRAASRPRPEGAPRVRVPDYEDVGEDDSLAGAVIQELGIGGGSGTSDTDPRYAPGDPDSADSVIAPGLFDVNWWEGAVYERAGWGSKNRPWRRVVVSRGQAMSRVVAVAMAIGLLWVHGKVNDPDRWIYYDSAGNERSSVEMLARKCMMPSDPCGLRTGELAEPVHVTAMIITDYSPCSEEFPGAHSSARYPGGAFTPEFTPSYIEELRVREAQGGSDQERIEKLIREWRDEEEQENAARKARKAACLSNLKP
ncbi:hypothetical protein HON52_03210 [Candidatus Uhrbacteria bacterium]|jgi:hypothetical protein|nr:hypothetical protein [Candidatus Uhrbacteria bacterium]